MSNQRMEIDLVYLWVDGSDPKWQAKKRAFTGAISDNSEVNNKGRYINNDELRYALRSVEKHAPWIQRIFIVTDNQRPEWLNTDDPRIHIVDHADIMPPEALPCFNSIVIEHFLYRIPGLSEYFLFANDDMFFNADVTPAFFFGKDGYPIVRLQRKPLGKWRYRWKRLINKPLSNYRNTVANASRLVEEKFGKYYPGVPHHNIDAYRKSDYQTAVEDVFDKEIETVMSHHVRHEDDILRVIYLYYGLAIGRGHLKHVTRKESLTIDLNKPDYRKRLLHFQPQLFCLNDNQYVSDSDRRRIKPFLQSVFPKKSTYEK
ncbi:stealth family protein [Parapedobacter soli]|uniref:stealth family protein n=1 Tax=Parapedobacter soli TaxID=416955 RepID=UPI0021C8AE69|nr:stealth family protein [Parapedobacter soli]